MRWVFCALTLDSNSRSYSGLMCTVTSARIPSSHHLRFSSRFAVERVSPSELGVHQSAGCYADIVEYNGLRNIDISSPYLGKASASDWTLLIRAPGRFSLMHRPLPMHIRLRFTSDQQSSNKLQDLCTLVLRLKRINGFFI
jgi:hypothetical protein